MLFFVWSFCGCVWIALALPADYFFQKVSADQRLFKVVTQTFENIIAPIYGDQSKALSKIASSNDRECLLLFKEDEPRGLLVFKNEPNNEYEDLGLVNSLEVKTLLVLNLPKNIGRGFGKILVDKAKEEAHLRCASGVHLTVSEGTCLRSYFEHMGFSLKKRWVNRFGKAKVEHLLYWSNQ